MFSPQISEAFTEIHTFIGGCKAVHAETTPNVVKQRSNLLIGYFFGSCQNAPLSCKDPINSIVYAFIWET